MIGDEEPCHGVPHGTGHALQDQLGSRIRRLDWILADNPVDADLRLEYGGRGARTTLLCGGFELSPNPDEVLSLLPPVLVLDADAVGSGRWIEPFLLIVRGELCDGGPGGAAVLNKVGDVFLTEVLRQFLVASDAWTLPLRLEATGEDAIAEAVRLLHREPQVAWTLAALAHKVGMSRTALAARFRSAVGESPMRYLADVRLGQGARWLTTTSRGLAEVARAVGYDNEASFSKAFKRRFGLAPGAYRTARRAAPL